MVYIIIYTLVYFEYIRKRKGTRIAFRQLGQTPGLSVRKDTGFVNIQEKVQGEGTDTIILNPYNGRRGLMSYVTNTLHRKVHLVSVLKTLEQELNPQPADEAEPRGQLPALSPGFHPGTKRCRSRERSRTEGRRGGVTGLGAAVR